MADLTVRFIGDVSKLQSATNKAEGIVGKFSGKMGGLGKIIGGVFGGNVATAGAQKLIGVMGDVIGEAREAEKVTKLTDAAIKSTGGVANVTAGQVADLAESLSVKTGIGDEAIQANENLLLTFTNVHNEVGRGNDIFNQATAAVQDMSVALGQDSASSAIQLGKALNDPIKGITALSRVGVSFTKQQKDQIAALVKSGNVLGAQKIILKELGKEFGGAAAAAATPMDKLKVRFKNLEEQLGKKLLPAMNTTAQFLNDELPGALDTTGQAFSDLGDVIKDLLKKAQPLFDVLGPMFKQAFEGIKKLIDDLADAFGTDGGTILKVIAGIVTAFGLSVAWALVPGLIIVGILALYNRFQFLRTGVVVTIKTIVAVVKAFAITLKAVFGTIVTVITGLWDRFGDDLVRFTRTTFASISQFIQGALNIIRGIFQAFSGLLHGDWSRFWDGIKLIVSGAWETIKATVRQAVNIVRTTMQTAWDGVGDRVKQAWNGIVDFFKGIPGRIASALSSVFANLVNPFIRAFNFIVDKYNSTVGRIPIIGGHLTIPEIPLVGTGGRPSGSVGQQGSIRHLAKGGVITGPTSGYLAMLHGREKVEPLNGSYARTGTVTNITINAQGIGDRELGRQVVQALREYQRTRGPLNLKIAG